MYLNLFALTAGLAASASAFDCSGYYFSFFNRGGDAMSYQRLDPALFPGRESTHLHSFDGGIALSASTNYAQTQTSSCSTARVKTDKSLYWRPSLFWNGNGTGFHRVAEKYSKIYYKSGDNGKWANVTGFPEDFNMIAGDPLKRSDGDNPAGIRWACHQPDGSSSPIFSNGFPKGFSSCDNGLAVEITFPSCWNGEKLDPKNANAHMAFPNENSGVGIENCPSTHRAARFPTIFIEFWYDVSAFNGQFDSNDTPWVLSNGDPTGFGFHADFLNGWEKGVLEKATGETGGCNCGCGCGQEQMEQCFGAENVNKDEDEEFKSCSPLSEISAPKDTKVLDKLPGCNPLQSGPARATVVTGPDCDVTAAPAPAGDETASSYAASKTSSAVETPAVAASAATPAQAYPTPDANTDAFPSLSLDLPGKQVDNAPTAGHDAVTPSSTIATLQDATKSTPASTQEYEAAPTDTHPSVSLATTAQPAGQTGNPSTDAPSGDNDEECPAPVYVTVTPTVYVTATAAAVHTTSCSLGGTVYQTVTETATVTLPAIGGVEYAKS